MRLPLLTMIILIIINLATDAFVYNKLKRLFKSTILAKVQLISSILLFILVLIIVILPKRSVDNSMLITIMWMLYTYFSFYVLKYIFIIFYALSSITIIFKRKPIKSIRIGGLGISIGVFLIMWWGALIGRNNIEVERITIPYSNLPKLFNNFKIAQISDFHVGTFGTDTVFVNNVVEKINSLTPDLIVFSGDIVNRQSDELKPFVSVLSRLKAPYGIVSVLGNHDYGDYRDWATPEEKERNMQELISLQREMGWNLLNNQSLSIKQGKDSITVIGVENWGDPPFKMYADLKGAYSNLNDSVFKVLVSHNPAHWKSQILPETNIDLTLSGHTHAMQISMDFFGKKISPAVFRYKEWGGLYEENKQKLYVNIGVGEVAIPMRVGATPEITLITLENAK